MRHGTKTEIEEFPFFAVVELAPSSLLFFQCDELWRGKIIVNKLNNKRLVLKNDTMVCIKCFLLHSKPLDFTFLKFWKLFIKILYRHHSPVCGNKLYG